MEQRVLTISGSEPVIVVAPHGFQGDDENTADIAQEIAERYRINAVINLGWERSDAIVDSLTDKADCNNVNHCLDEVVKEEFLDPILRLKTRLLHNHNYVYIYYIHGMSNRHRTWADDPSLDMVIGYGAGSPDSYSCDLWRKNLFMELMHDRDYTLYQGKKGGPLSAWARSNLNQYFRKWHNDPRVQSMQIEIIHALRVVPSVRKCLAADLGQTMLDVLPFDDYQSEMAFRVY